MSLVFKSSTEVNVRPDKRVCRKPINCRALTFTRQIQLVKNVYLNFDKCLKPYLDIDKPETSARNGHSEVYAVRDANATESTLYVTVCVHGDKKALPDEQTALAKVNVAQLDALIDAHLNLTKAAAVAKDTELQVKTQAAQLIEYLRDEAREVATVKVDYEARLQSLKDEYKVALADAYSAALDSLDNAVANSDQTWLPEAVSLAKTAANLNVPVGESSVFSGWRAKFQE